MADWSKPDLFQLGEFTLHSEATSDAKIECDALSDAEWNALATWAMRILPPFGSVEGVPRGGLVFAAALSRHVTAGLPLIVDDVLTSGGSMETQRAGRDAIGIVVFARGPCPDWVRPMFQAREGMLNG